MESIHAGRHFCCSRFPSEVMKTCSDLVYSAATGMVFRRILSFRFPLCGKQLPKLRCISKWRQALGKPWKCGCEEGFAARNGLRSWTPPLERLQIKVQGP